METNFTETYKVSAYFFLRLRLIFDVSFLLFFFFLETGNRLMPVRLRSVYAHLFQQGDGIRIRQTYTCYYPVKLTFMDALLSTVQTSVPLSISRASLKLMVVSSGKQAVAIESIAYGLIDTLN